MRFVLAWIIAVLAVSLPSTGARALGDEPRSGETLTQYLTPAILEEIFPGADKVGEVSGTPPAAAVYKAGRQLGYLFSSWDVTQSTGFSHRPLVLLVGVDLSGHIAAARLVHHTEPISILGLKDEQLHSFVEHYKGHDLNAGVDVVSELSSSVLGSGSFSQRSSPGTTVAVKVDAVSRATTSSVLMSDAIVRGARILARSRGLLGRRQAAAHLDVDRFAPADWAQLEATGAVSHLQLTYGELRAKLGIRGSRQLGDPSAADTERFLDVYLALLSPAGIGINVLGATWYGQYTAGRGINDQFILLAANGPYSILGTDWEHADTIDSVALLQGEKSLRLSGKQLKALPFLHAKKAPELSERALIFLAGGAGLEPTQPFALRLAVKGAPVNGQPSLASFDLHYRVPDEFVVKAQAPPPAAEAAPAAAGQSPPAPNPAMAASDHALAWQQIWWAQRTRILILGVALAALTLILLLQDQISRRRKLHRVVRIAFLSFTVLWLGWYAGAQLTVINLLTYIHTAVSDRRWDYVLADPLVSIISAFSVAGLFLWGRAVFCGWLCPFGALQELVNKAAARLKIPQLSIPMALHERLIVIKYLLFLGLVAVSFFSWDLAMAGAEIEPFKAAIILRFMTEWPMVLYAAALVLASAFIERFYCRFACPLGGGLAIFGRVRMFNWLQRHPECGTRCRLCEQICPVGAIKRSGEINMNECFYCLDCQVTYYDDHVCPPMAWRRKRQQQPAASAGLAAARKAVPGLSA